MNSPRGEALQFDALVIGAGVAGLRAAIVVAEAGARVAVVTKDDPEESSSSQARGGIAVALSGEEEELVLHEADTLRAGAGLCDPAMVRVLVREGREEVLQLIEWGTRFDRQGNLYHLAREGAHSLPRILHAGGDATGREIVRVLLGVVRGHPRIVRLPGAIATDLLIAGGRCAGARILTRQGPRRVIAGGVVLATGGFGQCWKVTSNPAEATGDGVALALRAGCVAGDMEFVQFHPTALAVEGAPPVLLTEALRGEGGVILNAQGRRFLYADDARGELAPRDVVARGIAAEIARQGGAPVLIDLRGLGGELLKRRFPRVVEACTLYGVDPTREPVPVRPAAHYAMGGVVTDPFGRTGLKGLLAAGEVASVGVHGANRLASNSLLEGLVFGARAGQALLDDGLAGSAPGTPEDPAPRMFGPEDAPLALEKLRDLAERALGILRHRNLLHEAIETLDQEWLALGDPGPERHTRAGSEAASAVLVLRAVARAALWRRETRGAHARADAPYQDDKRFLVHSRQKQDGVVYAVGLGEP